MVVTSEGEMRAPSIKGSPAVPVRQHLGLPRLTVNKGSRQAALPDRKAMSELVGGDPVQQSLGNYAKLTPSGASAAYGDFLSKKKFAFDD